MAMLSLLHQLSYACVSKGDSESAYSCGTTSITSRDSLVRHETSQLRAQELVDARTAAVPRGARDPAVDRTVSRFQGRLMGSQPRASTEPGGWSRKGLVVPPSLTFLYV
jgi:hypothetical protein